MKIFSNFNTKTIDTVLHDKLENFKKSEVFVIHRSNSFLLFYVLPHALGYLALLMLIFLIFMNLGFNSWAYIGFFLIWLLIFWFRIVHKFLRYICDFTVVTPGGISIYKQKGILHSLQKEIPAKRIKAVEICRDTLLGNIFGYGCVDIIADLNEFNKMNEDYASEAPWVVSLTHVDKPHKVKAKISKICFR